MRAHARQSTEIAKYLLTSGADFEIANTFGQTPLDIAAAIGATDLVEVSVCHRIIYFYLISRNILFGKLTAKRGKKLSNHINSQRILQLGKRIRDGGTLIHALCSPPPLPFSTDEVLPALLHLGCSVAAKDYNGCTPLHLACNTPEITTEQVEKLISAGTTQGNLAEAIRGATYSNSFAKVQLLMSHGASISDIPIYWSDADILRFIMLNISAMLTSVPRSLYEQPIGAIWRQCECLWKGTPMSAQIGRQQRLSTARS